MLDLTKPVQTRAGKKVRLLCTDRKAPNKNLRPVVGLVQKSGIEELLTWSLDGKSTITGDHPYDLINAPEIKYPCLMIGDLSHQIVALINARHAVIVRQGKYEVNDPVGTNIRGKFDMDGFKPYTGD